jgi:hypothetical protein
LHLPGLPREDRLRDPPTSSQIRQPHPAEVNVPRHTAGVALAGGRRRRQVPRLPNQSRAFAVRVGAVSGGQHTMYAGCTCRGIVGGRPRCAGGRTVGCPAIPAVLAWSRDIPSPWKGEHRAITHGTFPEACGPHRCGRRHLRSGTVRFVFCRHDEPTRSVASWSRRERVGVS